MGGSGGTEGLRLAVLLSGRACFQQDVTESILLALFLPLLLRFLTSWRGEGWDREPGRGPCPAVPPARQMTLQLVEWVHGSFCLMRNFL